MNWKRVEQKYTVVEIEKPEPLVEDSETISAVASLRTHVGFRWLARKLKLQAARLRAELENSRNENNQDVYLKAGIFWCNWLQSQTDFAHERYLQMRDATASEGSIFAQMTAQIELIGKEGPQAPE